MISTTDGVYSVELFNTIADEILRYIISRLESSYLMLAGHFNIDLIKIGKINR